jgi:hypothetical protein
MGGPHARLAYNLGANSGDVLLYRASRPSSPIDRMA